MTQTNANVSGRKVPVHLRQFVVEQDYDKYTPIDHAVWRYVMRQNHNYLGKRAHEAYLEGLKTSGIHIDRIPNIEEMNECLSRIGWGAVTINGFIPAVAFFDFQKHGFLPIACDIRTYDHIAYTPAPDIIHEAAGHAPIIADEKYRFFLKKFGEIGSKAISSREDFEVYEAIRLLSIVKEDPNATEEQIKAAEEDLERKVAAVKEVSEAAEVARLYWWTVEYGLIGDLDNPQIYGAGLLSSVGESISCMKDDVKKIPFSLEACISTDYDITKPQPQLFVCKNFDELIEAVEEYSNRMAYKVGGTSSLIKALKMGQTSTSVYSSGLQVSGMVSELVFDDQGEAIYIKTAGPTQLSVDYQELPGHGKAYHEHGFGSPIGRLQGVDTPLEEMSDQQLAQAGIEVNRNAAITFTSGVTVKGTVKYVERRNGKVVLIGFDQCTVTYRDQVLFQAEWGTYDMAVGERIVSVFAGAADLEKFEEGTYKPSETKLSRPVYDEKTLKLHGLYQQVRDIREGRITDGAENILYALLETIDAEYQNDWLLRLEVLELAVEKGLVADKEQHLRDQLHHLAESNEDVKQLIHNGLALLPN